MNYKNFENSAPRENEKKTEKRQEAFIHGTPGSGKSFGANYDDVYAALDNEFDMFTKVAEILARQEYKKRRFYSFLKKAVFAFSFVLIFSGIIFFAKIRKSDKGGKSKKNKKSVGGLPWKI